MTVGVRAIGWEKKKCPVTSLGSGGGERREEVTAFVVGLLGAVEGVAHKRVVKVSLGEKHGCVVMESGSLYVWGDDVSEFDKIDAVSTLIFRWWWICRRGYECRVGRRKD